MPSIASQVSTCLEAFRSLIAPHSSEVQQGAADQLSIPGMEDALARFKVWSANIGAHRSGRSSLDFRLRDSSKIRVQVLQLLEDLSESLLDGEPPQILQIMTNQTQ